MTARRGLGEVREDGLDCRGLVLMRVRLAPLYALGVVMDNRVRSGGAIEGASRSR